MVMQGHWDIVLPAKVTEQVRKGAKVILKLLSHLDSDFGGQYDVPVTLGDPQPLPFTAKPDNQVRN